MSFFDWGDKPITSYPAFSSGAESAVISNPASTTLLAEIDSTQLHAGLYGGTSTGLHRTFQITWEVGGSSNVSWRCESAPSTDLTSTGTRQRKLVFTSPNQSAQFTTFWTLQRGDRLRVLVASTVTGNYAASITAVPLT